METRSISARPDVALATSAPRVTPTPPRASRFGEVLAQTAVRSAESAMSVLPGAPYMALAVRSATGGGAVGVPMGTMSNTGRGMPDAQVIAPGGLGAAHAAAAGAATGPAPATGPGPAAAGGEGPGLEAALQQSQDMNLYFLQIQEAVNAQNRSFTALSNVLKAQHDTVKTAIGNIR